MVKQVSMLGLQVGNEHDLDAAFELSNSLYASALRPAMQRIIGRRVLMIS
jgi:hypothetical protein